MAVLVRERRLIVKTVFETGPDGNTKRILSQKSIQDGPELVREYVEGESDYPTPRPTNHLWEIGYWKRLRQAIRRYGLDGRESDTE